MQNMCCPLQQRGQDKADRNNKLKERRAAGEPILREDCNISETEKKKHHTFNTQSEMLLCVTCDGYVRIYGKFRGS